MKSFSKPETVFRALHALRLPQTLERALGGLASRGEISEWLEEALLICDSALEQLSAENWLTGTSSGGMASPERGPILYTLVRAIKPKSVVETGVASGSSSWLILEALDRNRLGTLNSIDLPSTEWSNIGYHQVDPVALPTGKQTGWLVPNSLRGRWTLHLGDTRALLPAVLAKLGHIDLFLHDSEHTRDTMLFEYDAALKHLGRFGVLASDDIQWNDAFDTFVSDQDLIGYRLGTIGIARRRARPPVP